MFPENRPSSPAEQGDYSRAILNDGIAVQPPAQMEQWTFARVVGATLLLTLVVEILSSLRRGDVGLDIVAALSMTAALLFGEELAAVVVALMYAGGQYLESFAERHARREMTALLERTGLARPGAHDVTRPPIPGGPRP